MTYAFTASASVLIITPLWTRSVSPQHLTGIRLGRVDEISLDFFFLKISKALDASLLVQVMRIATAAVKRIL